MELRIHFPGGQRVAADFNGHTIVTDQPVAIGGEGSAPSPFDLFLASVGTCAGFYVLTFCRQRELPTEGLSIVQRLEVDEATRQIDRMIIEIHLPAGFPARYREAVVKTANLCAVKKHLAQPPEVEVVAVPAGV